MAIALAAVATCLLATAPVPPCMVLCVGEDGHIAIEHAHEEGASPCKGHESGLRQKDKAVSTPAESHGHSCLDFPLSAASATDFPPPAPGADKSHPANATPANGTLAVAVESREPRTPTAPDEWAAGHALPALRTVILLI